MKATEALKVTRSRRVPRYFQWEISKARSLRLAARRRRGSFFQSIHTVGAEPPGGVRDRLPTGRAKPESTRGIEPNAALENSFPEVQEVSEFQAGQPQIGLYLLLVGRRDPFDRLELQETCPKLPMNIDSRFEHLRANGIFSHSSWNLCAASESPAVG